ncbi:MAG: leucine-rich repeat domain-containing protein [Ruminococcus flavefaciens]|nr:leucine-rich repeat domain-containing protein [Ruminococcus flavefaciens]
MKKQNPFISFSVLPGTWKSSLQLLQPLSLSGYSSVYLAQDKKENNRCAIKIVKVTKENRKMIEAISRLSNNYICVPQEYCVKNQYLCMRYPYFTPLTEKLEKDTLSLIEILSLGIDLCNSLIYLHNHGIFHFDISVGNIFLNREGHYILGDYSHSRFISSLQKNTAGSKNGSMAVLSLTDYNTLIELLQTLLCDGKEFPDMAHQLKQNFPNGLEAALLTEKAAKLSSYQKDSFSQITVFEQLRLSLEQLIQKQEIQNHTYSLKLEDRNHPLLTAKTDSGKNICTAKEKKQHSIYSYAPCFLLLLCISIFSFSFWNYKKAEKEFDISDLKKSNITTTVNTSTIDISNSNLNTISDSSYSKNDITPASILFAHSNSLVSLDGIESFQNITELYLSDNRLTDIRQLRNFKQLKILDVSHNDLSCVTSIDKLKTITFLNLSGNQKLKSVQPLSNLKELKLLILTETAVQSKEIKQLQKNLPNCTILY